MQTTEAALAEAKEAAKVETKVAAKVEAKVAAKVEARVEARAARRGSPVVPAPMVRYNPHILVNAPLTYAQCNDVGEASRRTVVTAPQVAPIGKADE